MILIHFFIPLLLAQTPIKNETLYLYENYQKTVQDAQIEPVKYLENESMLEHSKNGIPLEPHYTGLEKNKLSFSAQASVDYENFSELNAYELQYARRFETLTEYWYGLSVKSTVANFDALSDEVQAYSGSSSPNANSSQLRDKTDLSINSAGLLIGSRFKFLSALNVDERLYEFVNTSLTYNLVTDSLDDTQYTGFGFSADYSLQYRVGISMFLGAKLGYNMAAVVRDPKTNEAKRERSLSLSWSTIAVELGYYF